MAMTEETGSSDAGDHDFGAELMAMLVTNTSGKVMLKMKPKAEVKVKVKMPVKMKMGMGKQKMEMKLKRGMGMQRMLQATKVSTLTMSVELSAGGNSFGNDGREL